MVRACESFLGCHHIHTEGRWIHDGTLMSIAPKKQLSCSALGTVAAGAPGRLMQPDA